jgi:hypothetical protein
MSAGQIDMVMEQGADWTPLLSLENDDGTPVNLLGYTAHLQVRSTFSAATVLLDLTSQASQILLGADAGTILFAVPASTASLLVPDTTQLRRVVQERDCYSWGVYDLHLVSPSGIVIALLAGDMCLAPAVTKESA